MLWCFLRPKVLSHPALANEVVVRETVVVVDTPFDDIAGNLAGNNDSAGRDGVRQGLALLDVLGVALIPPNV